MTKFKVYDLGHEHPTKGYNGKTFPILSMLLKAELKDLVNNELVPRMNRSVPDHNGTSVLGAGIRMYVFPSARYKYPRAFMLLSGPHQSNISNWKTLEPVIKFLTQEYAHFRAEYYDGFMD